MNRLFILLYLLFPCLTASAQSVINYSFASGTTTFVQLTGGTTATLNGNTDDGFYTGIPIGFNFIYNSTVYTNLSASTNGFISLGSNISNANSQANNLATGTGPTSPRPIIAPLWDDNEMTTANGFSYQTSGTAPNRVFTAEWLNIQWNYNASAGCLSMQLKLYEANSRVEFIYRPEAGSLFTPSASLGITNVLTGPRNFLCLTSVSGLPFDTSTVTETNTINTKPNNGQRFSFSPQFAIPTTPVALTYSAITPMSMNVNWVDNATTETYYQLFISTDAVNYNLYSTVNSTTRATTGTNYSTSVSGLIPGVTYYYRLFVCNEGSLPTSFVAGSQATLSGLLSGVKTVCPTGCDYPTITNALTNIRNLGVSGNFILEMDSTYDPSLETYPLSYGNLQTTAANNVTIRPRGNVSIPIVFTGFGASTFDLNNTRFLTIDGRRAGAGSGGFIQITNLTGSGTAVSFTNNSSDNTFRDCIITGATSSTTSGVIVFGNSSAVSGNNGNTIINCTIKDSIATPIQCIYSSGNASFPNQSNIIQNNRIINYYNGSNSNFGINLAAGSENWTISGNSFYQETARSLSFNTATAISIASGSTHTIQNNFFGGTLPLCTGSPLNYTGDGTVSMISISAAVSGTVQVTGNTISNINLELNNSTHYLINLVNGTFNVSNNLIGSTTQNGNVRLFTNATGSIFSAISLGGGSNYGVALISGNQIGGITVNGGGTAAIRGINITANTPQLNITNNYLGSPSINHSMIDSTFADVTGIFLQVTSTNNNITGNTVSNLTAASNSSSNRTTGIFAQGAGAFNISSNTIRRLVTNGTNTGTTNLAHLHGILITAGGSSLICNNNIIDGLLSLNPFLTLAVNGIYFNTTGTGNSLSGNIVKSIFPYSSGTCTITGIFNATSSTNTYNNMVRLGLDTAGVDMNTNHNIIGIHDAGNSNAYIHNSVYIGGANIGGTSAANTAAFFNSIFSIGTRIIANNIFANTRSNSSALSKHYCLFLTANAVNGTTINNNIYFAPGNGGTLVRYNNTDINSLTAWRAVANFDINSGNGNPNFVAPQAANASLDLRLGSTTPAEGTGLTGTPVTTDFEGQTRVSLTPVDIGADAGNYQTVDIFASVITHTQVGNTSSFSNRTITADITDIGTGVRMSGSLQPRLWYRRTAPSATSWVSTGGVLTSGTLINGTWTFTLDYALIPGTPAINNQYQYYIVAQDSASPVNIAILPFSGASHTDVNTQLSAPTTPYSYSLVGSLPVSINVGVGQTYTSLTGAGGLFSAINNGALSGNTVVTIVSDITETGANLLNNAGLSGFNLLIRPDNQLRTLSGSFTLGVNGLIHLNGATRVTIDGGPNRNLLIRNISGTTPSGSTAPTIWIMNGVNDTIRNCVIEGNGSNPFYAAVNITTNSAGSTSSGLVLLNNVIRGALLDAANCPASGVTVWGAANNIQNLTIQANTIFDFSTYGILLNVTGNNALIGHPTDTSLGNNIYQRAPRGAQSFIAIASGTGHVVGSNKLFSSRGIVHSGTSNGIWVASSINGITIINNSIGGCNPNRGGGYFQTSGTWNAINMTAGTSITSLISSNRIGKITATNFYGINIAGGMVNVLNNQIGGLQDTIIANGIVNGITSSSSSAIQINSNSISHLINIGANFTQGVSISSGTNTVIGNTIQSLYTSATTQNAPDLSCAGIRISTTTSGNIVKGNTIFTLVNTSSTLATSVAGIAVNNAWTGSEVYANRIYGLDATNTGAGSNSGVIYGIYIGSSGSAIYHNNQISIIPPTINNQTRIRGIELNTSGGVNEFYYNSIFIGGTANGTNTTTAFFRNTFSSTVALIMRNNILYNQRTSSSQTHYALSSSFFGSFTHNHNLYVGGNINMIENPVGTSRTLASWNSLTGNPVNNLGNLTSELPSAQFFTSTATGDLATNSCRVSNAGSAVSITSDFNNITRSSIPDIGSVEFTTASGFPVITAQPSVPSAVCAGAGTRNLTVSTSGYGINYQWQQEIGGLWSNLINGTNYTGVATTSLSIVNPPISFNGNKYRCLITGACPPVLSTDTVVLTVNDNVNITAQPSVSTICSGSNARFIVVATGSVQSFQWQINTGSGWSNLSVSATYPNVTDDSLNILGASSAFNGYLYRCLVNGSCNNVTSNQAVLNVNTAPTITAQPSNNATCLSGNASFTLAASGSGLNYQWQENQGSGWNNLSNNVTYNGVNTASLTINGATLSMNTYQYRCFVSGTCSPNANSNTAVLTVSPTSVGGSVSGGTTICSGATSGTLTLSGNTGNVVRWESAVAPFTTWTSISNTTTTHTSGALTQTTQFRAVVQSGTCPEANSSTTTVTVTPATAGGSVSGSTPVCSG
ncbi:MAG: beta strand repeat-containing protein, partial [Bacteroidota bacterium]